MPAPGVQAVANDGRDVAAEAKRILGTIGPSASPSDVAKAVLDAANAQIAANAAQVAAAAAQAASTGALQKTGGTMTGALTLAGPPTTDAHAANRGYVLDRINALVGGAGPAVDTLKELADILAADESVAAALATTVAGKASQASVTAAQAAADAAQTTANGRATVASVAAAQASADSKATPASVAAARRLGGVRVYAIGDSITAGQGTPPGIAFHNGYLTWAEALSGGAIKYAGHAAVPGQTTQQIQSTSLPAPLALSPAPHYCCVFAGTNNMGDSDLTAAQTALVAMFTQLRAAGIEPVAFTLPPRESITTLQRSNTAKWNAWLTRRCELDGIVLVDVHGILVDPTDGTYLTAADTGDGLHPAAPGYKKIGQALANAITPRINAWRPSLRADSANGYDLIPDGLFLTDANRNGLADTWSVFGAAGSPTYQLVADAAIKGNWQRLAQTTAVTNVLGITGIPAVIGHRYSWSGRFKINSMASGAGMQFYWCNTANVQTFGGIGDANYLLWQSTETVSGPFEFEFTVPAKDVTNANITGLTLALVTTGGAADVQVAQQSLRDLTALGVA